MAYGEIYSTSTVMQGGPLRKLSSHRIRRMLCICLNEIQLKCQLLGKSEGKEGFETDCAWGEKHFGRVFACTN